MMGHPQTTRACNVTTDDDAVDVLIIGAGPIGIACAVDAARAGLSHRVLEKGCLTSALAHFPTQLTFFSTSNLLELGDVPFITAGAKPTRHELLLYYRRVAEHFAIDVRLYEAATDVRRTDDAMFAIQTTKGTHRARAVVLAIGFYDFPNLLGVSGEDLPKVTHYYTEPHAYYRQRVAVIGGQNSAAEAALDIYRNGAAAVTLIHRGSELGSAVKYWVRPDIDNRIREGNIRALWNSHVLRIDPDRITVRQRTAQGDVEHEIANDFVLAMTGYRTDLAFLRRCGIELSGDQQRPAHDPQTMQTNVPGLYIAGVAAGGIDTNRIFIENGRDHARRIAATLANR